MDSTLNVWLLGNAEGLEEAMAKGATASTAAADKISKSGSSAASSFSKSMDEGTSKVGGFFKRLGSQMSNWGLPFSNSVSNIGTSFESAESRGASFAKSMSLVGGVAVAALAAVGVESVRMADKFEAAQSSAETAVKNSGQVWSAWSSKIKAASETSSALVVANSTEVEQAFATLTTATNSPAKALATLGTAENLAAMKHISLADATGVLVKLFAGSIRPLMALGINLDVTTSKLHSVQSAEEALQKAHLALETIQAEIATGQETGARAAGSLASAQLTVRNDTLALSQAQHSQAVIMDALNQRLHGTADALGKTLAGQVDIARNTLHNLGTDLGVILIPKLEDLLGWLAKGVTWLTHFKAAGEAVGILFATVLSAAVAVFVGSKLIALGSALGKVGQAFYNFGLKAATAAGTVQTTSTATAAKVAADDATIDASNLGVQGSFEGMGTKAAAAGTTIDASMAAAVPGVQASAAAMVTAIGTVVVELGLVVAAYALFKAFTFNPPSFQSLAPAGGYKTKAQFDKALMSYTGGMGVTPAVESKAWAEYQQSQLNGPAGIGGGGHLVAYRQQAATVAAAKTPGSTIPNLGGTPALGSGGGAAAASTAMTPSELALDLKGITQNEALKLATSATAGGSFKRLTDMLTAAHQHALTQLIASLNATHNAALTKLAATLETTFQTAIQKVLADQALAMTLRADTISRLAAVSTARTSLASTRAATGVTVSGLGSTATTDKITAAAQALTDAAKIQQDDITAAAQALTDSARLASDAAAAEVQAAQDLMTSATDAANAQVSAINDATQAQVDTLGERGLYGLNLVAQEAKVALDQQKATDDANIAAAQAHLDQVTASTNATVALAQQRADQATATADAATALAQMNLDTATQHADAVTALTQSQANTVAITSAIAEGQAQASEAQAAILAANAQGQAASITDAAKNGTAAQQATAAAQAALLTANANAAVAAADRTATAITDSAQQANQNAQNAANKAAATASAQESAAQNAYNLAAAQGSAQEAAAAAALSAAQNNASILQAAADAQLGAITNSSAVQEAKLTAIYNVDQELANTQYAGSGLNIYFANIPSDDAAAIAAAVSWELRTKVS